MLALRMFRNAISTLGILIALVVLGLRIAPFFLPEKTQASLQGTLVDEMMRRTNPAYRAMSPDPNSPHSLGGGSPSFIRPGASFQSAQPAARLGAEQSLDIGLQSPFSERRGPPIAERKVVRVGE